MERDVSNRCVECGYGFLFGPVFSDFVGIIRSNGFRRVYNFDYQSYRVYCEMFGHSRDDEWPKDVTLTESDSMFLDCVVDPDMKCPRCGTYAFSERLP